MLARFIALLGLKFLAKKIAQLVLHKCVYDELRELAKKSDTKIDDEIAEEVIKAIDAAVDAF